jgi:hypothetical protein
MDIDRFNEYISNTKNPLHESQIKKHLPYLYDEIGGGQGFSERLYRYFNPNENYDGCPVCGNIRTFRGFYKGYSKYCSKDCFDKDQVGKSKTPYSNIGKAAWLEKRKETVVSKYGVDNVMNSDRVKQKVKTTLYKNHGVNSPFKINKEKTDKNRIISIVEKYGVSNVMLSPDFVKTHLENQGGWPWLSHKAKEARSRSFILKLSEKIGGDIISRDGEMITVLFNECGHESTFTRSFARQRMYNGHVICTQCNPIHKSTSHGQQELYDFVSSFVSDAETCNRSQIGEELDIYIPSLNIAIEYNGVYWHSELYRDSKYHINKTKKCEEMGIRLIHVWESDWTYRKDIVKSRISNLLGFTPVKIAARKCSILPVSYTDTKDFLNKNHIQGNVISSTRFGLYYNDELVSIMTFGSGRKSVGGIGIELLRFCNKIGYVVQGGASRLFKYFQKESGGVDVFSYADRCWSVGGLYENLGFVKISEGAPNYWYVVDGILRHRFSYRKDVLVKQGYDDSKTEREIMFERGFYRIYDCGSLKYKYTA